MRAGNLNRPSVTLALLILGVGAAAPAARAAEAQGASTSTQPDASGNRPGAPTLMSPILTPPAPAVPPPVVATPVPAASPVPELPPPGNPEEPISPDEEYVVVPRNSGVRGHLWVGEGLAWVGSVKESFGNRFRFGAELQIGQGYRYILGLTLVDYLSSAESDDTLGDLHRSGSDVDVGYFLIPNRLWIKYSYYLGSVRASNVTGSVFNDGHGLSVGMRVWERDLLNVAVEVSYSYLLAEANIPVFNVPTQSASAVSYPHANVVSVNLRVGFDIGGHEPE